MFVVKRIVQAHPPKKKHGATGVLIKGILFSVVSVPLMTVYDEVSGHLVGILAHLTQPWSTWS